MKIGNLKLKNNLILAPIAGYSDVGMRVLCYRYGAALTFTEMVSAKGLFYKNENTKDLLFTHKEENLIGVQVFGNDPEIIAHAIQSNELEKFDVIDINMGCPVPKIVKNGEGSALMMDTDRVYSIIKNAVKVADGRAITAKIRAGFTERDKNAVEVAQAIEAGGGNAVTVHGRTRNMFYSGKSDLEIIKQVKDSVKIPVIGNGDIIDEESYTRMLEYTGVDGVMLARGSIGKPYIFAKLLGIEYEFNIKQTIIEHINLLAHLPERVVINNMKKQIAYYVKGLKHNKTIKENCFKAETKEDIIKAIADIY